MTEINPAACFGLPWVRALTPYQPGKPIEALQRERGLAHVVKLASNENPLGPSPLAVEAVRGLLAQSHRYADGAGFVLKQALAQAHGLDPAQIVLGNGSNDVLELLARAVLAPAGTAAAEAGVCARHAFVVYALAIRAVGARLIEAPALAATSAMPFGHDVEALAEAASQPGVGVLYIANPNNPTGTWIESGAMRALIERVPPSVLVVVDEAYHEYADGLTGYASCLPWLAEFPNLVVTRTFSKAHGLAGLRVGWLACAPGLASVLERLRQPFNVSLPAQAAAVAALADVAHVQRAVELNRTELSRVGSALRGQGLGVLPSAGNFLCVDLGMEAAPVYEALLDAGVITRPIAGYGLPQHLRISIGLPEENDRLLEQLPLARASVHLP